MPLRPRASRASPKTTTTSSTTRPSTSRSPKTASARVERALGDRQPLRRRLAPRPPPRSSPRCRVPEAHRPRLRRQGWRDRHRRRVHGPPHARPPLEPRHPPGRRGQGRPRRSSASPITYATITFQNLFRLYEKLAGMTGTAETEAEEFSKIYDLDVVVIPTHRPMVRDDQPDIVYINERAKFNAVVGEIEEMHAAGRPVLVGTTSIEKSEYLANLLLRKGIAARSAERQAARTRGPHHQGCRPARAPSPSPRTWPAAARTSSSAPASPDLGGLHVIGTERHESRRIDNQLRGRAGRQGDPGSSRFFVSFGDDIMKRFAPEWVPGMMQKLGMTEDMPLESRMVTRAIEQAQQKVEGHNFDVRKRLVDFDDVINEHRKHDLRASATRSSRASIPARNVLDDMLLRRDRDASSRTSTPGTSIRSNSLHERTARNLPRRRTCPPSTRWQELGDELSDELLDRAEDRYEHDRRARRRREHAQGRALAAARSRSTTHWREHLTAIEDLRQSIGLQAYAQVDPLVAFKREGHDMYQQLVSATSAARSRGRSSRCASSSSNRRRPCPCRHLPRTGLTRPPLPQALPRSNHPRQRRQSPCSPGTPGRAMSRSVPWARTTSAPARAKVRARRNAAK